MVQEQANFWGFQRFFPKFPQTFPKTFWANLCANIFSNKDHENLFFGMTSKKRFSCDSANVGRYFFKSNNVGHNFLPGFQGFCEGFHSFCPNFHGFCPDFHQMKTLGARLYPRLRYHCHEEQRVSISPGLLCLDDNGNISLLR